MTSDTFAFLTFIEISIPESPDFLQHQYQYRNACDLESEALKKRKIRLEKLLRITTMADTMRFILIDKVVSLAPGREIKAVKSVSLAEEYLADHFPTFPVLPGVLLLQGLIESASWLVRETENFVHSMILLGEARNVKYKSFLAPGSRIEYTVEARTIEENISSFSGFGVADNEQIIEAKFGLRHFNLADENSAMAAVDAQVIENMKRRWELLRP